MNREWVLFHLREAHQELARTVAAMDADPHYGVGQPASPSVTLTII